MAFTHPPMFGILGVYFKKHRGLANSIFTGGGSVGGLIFAPIVVKLFEEYQFTGTMLIISGLLMNIFVAALLMRPIESYTKTKPSQTRDNDTEAHEHEQLLLKEDDTIQFNADVDLLKADSEHFSTESTQKEFGTETTSPIDHITAAHLLRMHSYDPTVDHHNQRGSPLLHRIRTHSTGRRQRTTSDTSNHTRTSNNDINRSDGFLNGIVKSISKSQVVVFASAEAICGSFVDINTTVTNHSSKGHVIPEAESKLNNNEENLPTSAGYFFTMKTCVLSVLRAVFDVGLLRNPVFLTFLLMAFSIMSGVVLLPVYIPTHAHDIGISNERIGILLSLMAAIDLVAKISMGVVADRKLIKRSTILIVVTIVLGTTSYLARFVNSFSSLLIFAIVAGMYLV